VGDPSAREERREVEKVPPPCLSPRPCRVRPFLQPGFRLRLCCDVIVFYDSFFGKKKSGEVFCKREIGRRGHTGVEPLHAGMRGVRRRRVGW
jgi:hypothetical protein